MKVKFDPLLGQMREKDTFESVSGDLSIAGSVGYKNQSLYGIKDSFLNPSLYAKLSLFDGGVGTEWEDISTGEGDIANDTTNIIRSDQSVRLNITTAGGSMGVDKTVTEDLTDKEIIFLRFYAADASVIHSLEIFFSTSGFFGSYFSVVIPIHGKSGLGYILQDGWNEVPIYQYQFIGSGTPDWATVNRIRIKAYAVSGETGSITLDELSAYPNLADKGTVMISFDDGWENQFTVARPILDKHRFPATAFIIGNAVGQPSYMTLAQLKQLKDKHRWDIANHSWTADTFDTLTDAEIETNIVKNINFLQANGLSEGHILAYPGGAADPRIVNVVRDYCSLARTISNAKDIHETSPFFNQHLLTASNVRQLDSLATVQGWIDDCESNRTVLILNFHLLVASATPGSGTEWNISDFEDLIDYLATKDVDVTTFSQYLRRYWDQTGDLNINGAIISRELSSDPADPAEGSHCIWHSDGTGTGDDGDIMMKITAGGVTKVITLVDFSAS